MAPSSKSGKHDNKQKQRKQDTHVVKLLNRGKVIEIFTQRFHISNCPKWTSNEKNAILSMK